MMKDGFDVQLADWKSKQRKAISIGNRAKWAKEVERILRTHLCYTSISLSDPDQVLAKLLIFIDSLLSKK